MTETDPRRRALYASLYAIRDAIRAYRARITDDAGDMPAQRIHAALVDLQRVAHDISAELAQYARAQYEETDE